MQRSFLRSRILAAEGDSVRDSDLSAGDFIGKPGVVSIFPETANSCKRRFQVSLERIWVGQLGFLQNPNPGFSSPP